MVNVLRSVQWWLPLMMAIVVAVTDATAQSGKSDDVNDKPVSFWMEKKLEYSQGILRGLAVGDLQSVQEKAEQMRVVSRVEGWVRNRKPGYREQFQAFEFANAEILRNAKANNLDGATIGFQQLTISCVSCHKILRDVD
jgi:cytochrome c556